MKMLAGLLAAGILLGTTGLAPARTVKAQVTGQQTHQVWITELDNGERITLEPNSNVTIRLSETAAAKWSLVSTTGDVVDFVTFEHAAALTEPSKAGTAVATFTPSWVGESTLTFEMNDASGKTLKTFKITFHIPVGTPGTEE